MNVTQERILEELVAGTNNTVTNLTVRIDSEHLVITGRAPSYYLKQLATQTAIATAGGMKIRNEISVEPIASRAPQI